MPNYNGDRTRRDEQLIFDSMHHLLRCRNLTMLCVVVDPLRDRRCVLDYCCDDLLLQSVRVVAACLDLPAAIVPGESEPLSVPTTIPRERVFVLYFLLHQHQILVHSLRCRRLFADCRPQHCRHHQNYILIQDED